MNGAWQNWPSCPDPIDLDDCCLVYGDPIDDETFFAELDEFNDCIDTGGHVWLALNNDVHCIHCGVLAMPMKASREAE
jgi:hypothetical protein